MNRDPRLLYGADIRKRILDEVVADIARLATRRKVGHLVSVGIGEFEEIAVYIRGQASIRGRMRTGTAELSAKPIPAPLPMSPAGRRPCRAGSARSRWQC